MEISKFISSIYNHARGFLEIASIQTPRYSFVIEKLDILYQGTALKTKVHYTPVGCYRPFKNFVSELNDKLVCRKFKPEHARMIIGIDTLENTLDFTKEEQTKTYLTFVKSCIESIEVDHA
jgi:hypothetical protein